MAGQVFVGSARSVVFCFLFHFPPLFRKTFLFWRIPGSILKVKRDLEMDRFIRLILIVLLAMPQGWCCFVVSCANGCADSKEVASPQNALSCRCCKQLDPESCQSDSKNDQQTRIPKSSECQCRFLIAATNSPTFVVVTAVDSGFNEPFRTELDCSSKQTVSALRCFAVVKLQILQCRWQC